MKFKIIIAIIAYLGVTSFSYGQSNFQNKIDSLLLILKKPGIHDTTKVNILNNLGYTYYNFDHNNTIEYANQGMILSKKIGYTKGILLFDNLLGISYMTKNRLTKAVEYFFEGLSISEKTGNKSFEKKFLCNIGLVYQSQKQFDKALEYTRKALKIAEEIKDSVDRITILSNIGMILHSKNDFNGSKIYLDLAYRDKLKSGNLKGLERIETNIANTLNQLKKYDSAMYYYEKALSGHQANNFTYGIYIVKTNIASIYLNIIKENQIVDNLSKLVLKDKKRYLNISLKNSFEALVLAKSLGDNHLMDIYGNISGAYSYLKQWENAYKYLDSAKAVSDTIYNRENIQKMAEIEQQGKIELSEKKIELLTKEKDYNILKSNFLLIITIFFIVLAVILFLFFYKTRQSNILLFKQNLKIKETGEELETLNEDLRSREVELVAENSLKQKFISIIAHDIRNPLHGIAFSSQFLASNFERVPVDDMKLGLNSIYKSSNNLLGLLTTLLDWARSQRNEIEFNLEKLNVKDLFNNIFLLFGDSIKNKKIELITDIPENISVYADKNMIEAVIRNLTSNAIKFTNEFGTIEIKAYIENESNDFIFYVKDNGVGIPKDRIARLFSIDTHFKTLGTNKEEGSGLGLLLCSEFLDKHHGSIFVESELNAGTTFTCRIPSKYFL